MEVYDMLNQQVEGEEKKTGGSEPEEQVE